MAKWINQLAFLLLLNQKRLSNKKDWTEQSKLIKIVNNLEYGKSKDICFF